MSTQVRGCLTHCGGRTAKLSISGALQHAHPAKCLSNLDGGQCDIVTPAGSLLEVVIKPWSYPSLQSVPSVYLPLKVAYTY